MVGIVSGIGPGLDLGSREVLGPAAANLGNAAEGRNNQRVFVNVASGGLVVQNEDQRAAAHGDDLLALRTYNSKGQLNDDNGDNWSTDVLALRLAGAINAAGSTVSRVDRDGSTGVYSYDATRGLYVSTDGAGAYDTIRHVAAEGQFEWRDGSTGAIQRFQASGAFRLVSAKDASGNAVTYGYGASGTLASVSWGTGRNIFYDYVGNNLAKVRTVVDGVTTSLLYAYDAENRLAAVDVDLGDGTSWRTSYTYHGSSKRLATIAQPDGTSLSFSYVDAGGGNYKLETVRNAAGQLTRFTYGVGYTTVTDALGLVTRYDHDAAGQLTKITAPAVAGVAASREFRYNARGDVVSLVDGAGRTTIFEYDANGNQVLQRDGAGNTVRRTFDARNQLVTETRYLVSDSDGAGLALPSAPQTARQVFDATGRNLLRFAVSAEGRVTEHRYNDFGERTTSITYLGGAYDISALGVDTALAEADLKTWVASQSAAATRRVDMTYDGLGQLQARTTYAQVDALGAGVAAGAATERHVYDRSGRLLEVVSPTGQSTLYTYDGLGRVTYVVDALGQLSQTTYDAANRKTIAYVGTSVTTSVYDLAGNLVSVSQSDRSLAALGEQKFFYDAANRLRMTQDATGVRSWMLYDEAGRKVADVDGNGTMREYSYDGSGLLTLTVSYANAVNTALLADATGLPNLAATVASVRPTATTVDRREWRSYDAAQRLLRTASSIGLSEGSAAVTEFRYDGASQLVSVVQYATAQLTTKVAAGAIEAPAAATATDRVKRHFYDAEGLLAGTLDGEGYLTEFIYNAARQLVQTKAYVPHTDSALRATGTLRDLRPAITADVVSTLNFYDGKGRLVGIVDGEGYLTEQAYDGRGNLVRSTRYSVRVPAGATVASTLAELRPASDPGAQTTTRTYDALDRITSETSFDGVVTRHTYDVDGNLVSTVRAADTAEARTQRARYDSQRRLVAELSAEGAALLVAGQTQAQVDAIWSQHATTHAYDAAGRRVSTTDAAGNRTLFYYDADGALTHTVSALGDVKENRYDARGRLAGEYAYAKRIATSGLAGGLVTTALTQAVAAVATAADTKVTYVYTLADRVAGTVDSKGIQKIHLYNVFGEETRLRENTGDGKNLFASYTVDRRGLRMATVADEYNTYGLKTTTSTNYDAFGRAVRMVDGVGNVREQAFDKLGRVVATTDPLGVQRTTTYDAFGRVLVEKDAWGQETRYAYDPVARSISVTTPEGITTRTFHTRHGQVQKVIDGKGTETSYTYDRDGRLLRTDTPAGFTQSVYDVAGHEIETVDARGTKTTYTYDAAHRVLTRRVDPLGLNLVTSYQYNGRGQQVQVMDPNGVITTREFDSVGRVLREVVDPQRLNLATVYTYNARGNMLSVTSPGGSVTQYTYDVLGRRTQEQVDPADLKLTRSWKYDGNDNVTSSTDANGNVTRYVYGAADRLVYTVDGAGNVRQNEYEPGGRITRTIAYANAISLANLPEKAAPGDIAARITASAQDQVEHRFYRKDGRVSTTMDAMGAVTKYTYDANGNVQVRRAYANRIDLSAWVAGTEPVPTAEDSRDSVLSTVYDQLGRAIYRMDGTGAVVAQSYDANGNAMERRAYARTIDSKTALDLGTFAAALKLVADDTRDEVTRNNYDAAGRLSLSADGTGAVTRRVYDDNGNVVQLTAHATPVSATSAVSTVVASAGDRTSFMAYDAANRLVFSIDPLKGVSEQVYDAGSNVVRRVQYANALALVPTMGKSTSLDAVRSAITASTALDRTTRHGYDAAGRERLRIDAAGAVTERSYDGAGNVIEATAYAKIVDPGGLASVPTLASMRALVVTSTGDRVSRSTYDAAGRLAYTVDATGAVTLRQYDGLGQLTRSTRYATLIPTTTASTGAAIAAAVQVSAGVDQVETFSYNAAGQLATSTDALNAQEAFTYDALGRKLAFVNKLGATWTYTYDQAGRMLTETSPKVTLTSVGTDGAGNVTTDASAEAAIVTRFVHDALGNLTERTEASGRAEQRTTRYEYDAAGRQVRVTHPSVGIYNAAADALTTNGATGVAVRTETSSTILQTRTFYDVLGNAAASVDIGGAPSQKTYDLAGRVVHEIDALGYVTRYSRNAFGDVTGVLRYGAATALGGVTITAASQAASRDQVETAVNAVGVDHSRDREVLRTYDRAGRLTQAVEPRVFVYDPGASAAQQTATTGRTTRTTYDAFGQAVQVSQLRNEAAGTWSTTTRYYDAVGRELAVVDALGYLTKRSYDAAGNVTQERQYTTAVASGWSTAGYSLPAQAPYDRVSSWTYDRLNRRLSEIRYVEYSTAADGIAYTGNATTSYGYDAVGNQVSVTDPLGNVTYSAYDALGRVKAVAAPARPVNGVSVIPVTEFLRDAYGNVVVKIEHEAGTAGASASGIQAVATDPVRDRITRTKYDVFGRATHATNAAGATEFFSYDAFGHVAKKWQGVKGNDNITRTLFEVNRYDKLGQLVEQVTPASTSVDQGATGIVTLSQSQAGVVTAKTEYNAFGEVTRQGTQGGRQEYFDYDAAGRLWRSNSGDGVDRITLYDAQGNATADIRSAGSGRGDVNIQAFTTAGDAAASASTRRTDTHYDLLGHVTQRVLPAREQVQGGAASSRQLVTASVVESATALLDEMDHVILSGRNSVALTWKSLAALGSGDIKVSIEYRTPVITQVSAESTSSRGGTLRTYVSGVLTAEAADQGTTLTWPETNLQVFDHAVDVGVGSVSRVVVSKKDVNGNWQVVIDQGPGAGAGEITVAAPSDPTSLVALEVRTAGSAGDTGWWAAALVNFGAAYRFDTTGLAAGNYEYRVKVTPPNESTRVVATGTAQVTLPALSTITTPLAFGFGGRSMLAWISPGAAWEQELRYRVNGSSGAWSGLPVKPVVGDYVGAETAALAAGTYQFELLWTAPGENAAGSHATGTFTITSAQAAYTVPASGTPPITGLVVGANDFGAVSLVWDAVNANVARYRLPGGAWTQLVVDNSGQWGDGSYFEGVQKASLVSVPPGTYEVEITASSPETKVATATLTVYAPVSGATEWRWVEVVETYLVPLEAGLDENGNMTYVLDGYGNIVYSTQTRVVYQWREVTLPTYTPTPTLTVTTPPYTPARYVAAVDPTYAVNVTTAYGSTALSSNEGAALSVSTLVNGDSRWQRPVVLQKSDRWGNVVERSDPRSTIWKTTYRYNFNDQLVEQRLPDAAGGISSASPMTSWYFDRVGRQVAVKDANGNVQGQVYDAAGNLVQERRADGGVVTHAYSVFGDKVRTTDTRGLATTFSYDKMGRLLTTTREKVGVYRVTAANVVELAEKRNITETWTYDQLGRKLKQTNGNGEVIQYTYDLRGNVVATQQPLGQVTRAAFDAQDRKKAEVDANGVFARWTYDYFGVLESHQDLDGKWISYAHDRAGQVVTQTNRGYTVTYSYDAAGQVTSIRDAANDKLTTYAYDLSGRRVRERVVQKGVTYQDNNLAYDARGNLRDVADARVHLSMEYDRAGNRTRVFTKFNYQGLAGETPYSSDRYFLYDAMNRQKVVDAVDAAGNIGTKGHRITYDGEGNRTSDTYWGRRVATSGGETVILNYAEDGTAQYATFPVTYTSTDGEVREDYRYDSLNRLESVVRDGVQVDLRHYDGAGRVVQSGPGSNLPTKYAELVNAGLAPDQMNGHEIRVNRYDANGRMLHQRISRSDSTLKADVSWDKNETLWDGATSLAADGYDDAGNVRSYVVKSYEGGAVSEYTTTSAKFEAYQAGVVSAVSSRLGNGSTTHQYDVNGFLTGVKDSVQPNNDRSFVNDANGRALFVNQGGKVLRQLIVNGEVLGMYGVGVDPAKPSLAGTTNPNFADIVDFDFGYARISASYPAAAPGAYTVRVGDTLQGIAQSAYGDSSLWYRIAEANGLASSSGLRVGQTVNIPNRVGTVSNNSSTFKPYDPSRIEGDKTPALPMPQDGKGGCGGVGQLLMIVVAIVVTIYTAGAAASAWGTVTSQAAGVAANTAAATATATAASAGGAVSNFAAGIAALSGGSATVGGAVVTVSGGAAFASGAAVSIASAAVGAAAGSVVSQLVGMATGVQDKFNWRGVALSALSGGISTGFSPGIFGQIASASGSVVVRAALANALTQGIGVVVGLQRKFDWRGVAASAVGAGVGAAVGDAVGLNNPGFGELSFGEQLGRRLVSGVAAGAAAAVARGGRVAVRQVGVDAFGNALGQSLAEAATSDTTRTMGAGPAPVSEGGGSVGGLKVSQSLYDSWGPRVSVPDVSLDRPAWDLYAGGTPRLSSLGAYGEQPYAGTYSEAGADGGVPVYVDSETGAESTPVRPQAVLAGRALPPLAPIPRVAIEPSAGQYVVGRVVQEMDGIRARLDALGEDSSTPSWLRFGAAMARGSGNWIPETVKFFAGAGGYALDSQLRGQVNTVAGNFLANDPIGTTKYAATRYWDDHSPLEIAADGFNLVAGGSISAPFGKLGSLAFRGTVTTVTEAGETALRWTQRLSDYSIEFPQMRTQALYNFAGAVDPRPLIPTIRNLRAEATALAPEGFEVVRISNGSAIMRYADDSYYSVPKGQYSLIPELRTMDTMGEVLTRRAQSIADSFDSRVSLTFEQSARLAATPDGWMKNRFLSAYKGSYVHAGLRDELPFIRRAEGLTYKTVGPDIVSSSGGMGLKYEITQLTPSLNAIYSHTKKYPSELLRYVTYR